MPPIDRGSSIAPLGIAATPPPVGFCQGRALGGLMPVSNKLQDFVMLLGAFSLLCSATILAALDVVKG